MHKILITFLLLTLTLFGFESYNYIDKSYKITQSTALTQIYNREINPHFDAKKLQFFTSHDNLKIAYKIFDVKNAKASIVISSGRTEGMVKYKELIYDLNANGYSVYILDHRGQGYSERLQKDTQIGDIKNFNNYVKTQNKLFLSHSMGGAIASLYVEEYQNDFDALVLSSPMHQPDLIFSTTSNLVCSLIQYRKSNLQRYIVGGKSFDEENQNFDDNSLTHSKTRYDIFLNEYRAQPSTKIGSPSVRWVIEACKGGERSVENATKATLPILLLQAQKDVIVNKKPQKQFCEKAKNCRGYVIDGAYHELFVEKDHIRNRALSAILSFFSKELLD